MRGRHGACWGDRDVRKLDLFIGNFAFASGEKLQAIPTTSCINMKHLHKLWHPITLGKNSKSGSGILHWLPGYCGSALSTFQFIAKPATINVLIKVIAKKLPFCHCTFLEHLNHYSKLQLCLSFSLEDKCCAVCQSGCPHVVRASRVNVTTRASCLLYRVRCAAGVRETHKQGITAASTLILSRPSSLLRPQNTLVKAGANQRQIMAGVVLVILVDVECMCI